MKHSLRFFLSIALGSIGVTGVCQTNEMKLKLDSYVKPYVETNNFNGSILVSISGKVLYENSFGYANLDFEIPNQTNTVYHIASVSKNLTAAAILLLEQKGKVKTTDLLNIYIPDYPRGDEISLHHLLTHTSGIPNINDMPEYNQTSKNPQTLEALISMFKNKPLEFTPGEKYKYSNSNYNLLALIIEKASKLSYGEFLKKEIFEPAGMNHTAHHAKANEPVKNLAIGYQSDGKFGLEKADYLDWSSKIGNGSLYTTINDLLSWDRALASNKILDQNSIEKMYTNYKANAGYGCFVKEHLNRKRYYMNGRSPGFTSYFARYPDDGLCIIVLANNYIPVATTMGMDIASIIFNEKFEAPQLKAQPLSRDKSLKLIGKYQFDKDFYRPNFIMTVSEENGRMSIDWGELIPTGELEFIARAFWSDVSFELDSNETVKYFIYDGYKGRRIQ
jgi:CubicO group peptidase (beta-lactamase class C family)